MRVSVKFDCETLDASEPKQRAELAALTDDTVAPKFVADGCVFTLEELQEMNEEGRLAAFLAGDV